MEKLYTTFRQATSKISFKSANQHQRNHQAGGLLENPSRSRHCWSCRLFCRTNPVGYVVYRRIHFRNISAWVMSRIRSLTCSRNTSIVLIQQNDKIKGYWLSIKGLQRCTIHKPTENQVNRDPVNTYTNFSTVRHTAVQQISCTLYHVRRWSHHFLPTPQRCKGLYPTYCQSHPGRNSNQAVSPLSRELLASTDPNPKKNLCRNCLSSSGQP